MAGPRSLLALGVACTVMSLGLTSCMTLSQPDAVQPPNGSASPSPAPNAVQPPSIATSPIPVPLPLVWADGTRVTANVQGIEHARVATTDEDFTVESETRGFVNEKTAFLVQAVDSSGTLVGIYGPRLSDQEQEQEQTAYGIDPESQRLGRYVAGAFEPFTVEGTSKKDYLPQEVEGMTVTDSGIIWGEIYSEDAASRGWKILSVAPGSTEVRVLATRSWKKGPNDDVERTMLSAPVLADGRVYWNFERSNSEDDFSEENLYSVDLEDPGAVRDEFDPTLTEEKPPTGSLYVWEDKVLAAVDVPADSKKGYTGTIGSYAPGGKRDEILREAEDSTAEYAMWLLGSDERGFTVEYDKNLYLVDPRTRQIEMFQHPEDAEISWLTQCGPLVAWTYQGEYEDPVTKRYVYHRGSKDLSVVSTSREGGMDYCSGDYMSWPTSDPQDPEADSSDVVVRWKN